MDPLSLPTPSTDRSNTHPSNMAAAVSREADALVFRGALVRGAVAALWRQAQPLRVGIARLDVSAVSVVDSAGLALLAELAYDGVAGNSARGRRADDRSAAGDGIAVIGAPAGLAELRAAYRLDDRLAFAS